MKYISLLILSVCITIQTLGTTYTVVNTNDAGAGSLRNAVQSCLANSVGAPHLIQFQIPLTDNGYDSSTGVWKIVFMDEGLPPFTSGYITIDGSTQTGFAGNTNPLGPEIMLNGSVRSVEYCISIQNASHITIKNIIINEFLYGIQIYGQGGSNNRVTGCYLGTNHDGTGLMGNVNAIEIISGANNNQIGDIGIANKNLISGNEYAGIRMSDANNNLIINNWVGIDRTGNSALRNYDGITVEGAGAMNQIGGSTSDSMNVSSGNVAYGVDIFGVGCIWNRVLGNFIGTNATGVAAIPNTYGLLCDDRSNHNIVGGYLPGQGNLISGNTAFGAYFYNNGTSYMQLIGNKIGTDVTGTYAIPNETGVHIDGASYGNFVDSNLISGNMANGITIFGIYSDYNTIIRNKIGTDITGMSPLGNGVQGILITQNAANNIIGGSLQNENIIAYNGQNGVKMESDLAKNNLISANSFFENGGLSIEIYPSDGVNINDNGDIDSGPNNMLNHPVIQSVVSNQGVTTISGVLDVASPTTTLIEIYLAEMNDNFAFEGKQYLGATYANAQGNWSFSHSTGTAQSRYVALTIDPQQNTSEFSFEYPQQLTNFTLTHSVLGANGSLVAWANNQVLSSPEDILALTDIYFTAYPDTMFKVKRWLHNGIEVTSNQTNYYSITDIQTNSDVQVEFELNSTGVTSNQELMNQSMIYPNPASLGETIYLRISENIEAIRIRDLSGREILSPKLEIVSKGLYHISSPSTPGTYLIELYDKSHKTYGMRIVVCD